jgi:hypothetical protein
LPGGVSFRHEKAARPGGSAALLFRICIYLVSFVMPASGFATFFALCFFFIVLA